MNNPIERIGEAALERYVEILYKRVFNDEGSVTLEELRAGAKLARNFGNHDDHIEDDTPRRGRTTASVNSEGQYLGRNERKAIKVQRSLAFWEEPKDLLVTLLACFVASLTQGWDQVANGNLGWPKDFKVSISSGGTGHDIWKFGLINAITWFSAAVLGTIFIDPICHTRIFGRRWAVLIAAMFSFASMVGASRAQSWGGYLVARLFLGIGIGAKASIIPIWESEILPQAKRGRLLVSWQVFVATGIFAGSCATYIFRDSWRNQVLSGALPALILLVLAFLCCESPRWLILRGKYIEAFDTLVRLRKERILAAEELCYIHFQVQSERLRWFGENEFDLGHRLPDIPYSSRLAKLRTPRNRRSAVASMIVMLSQQLSGINILAFLASVFFNTAGLRPQSADPTDHSNTNDSLRLTIGFGAANAIFSAIAYFLIEPLEVENRRNSRLPAWLCGRLPLLLFSLGGGTVMLFILTFLLRLREDNPAKSPLVTLFIILFTFFYSPGAGCVPFLYSAEIWPNEGREIGMSWAVFWNFLGAGFLALLVPRGFRWGPSKLFGIFTGLSFTGFLLVWLFVPATDYALTLEDMSTKFNSSLVEYGLENLARLNPLPRRGEEVAADRGTNPPPTTEGGTQDRPTP